jgi:hypothetical protein
MRHGTTPRGPNRWRYRDFYIEYEPPADSEASYSPWSRRYCIHSRDRRYYLHSLTEARRMIDSALDP